MLYLQSIDLVYVHVGSGCWLGIDTLFLSVKVEQEKFINEEIMSSSVASSSMQLANINESIIIRLTARHTLGHEFTTPLTDLGQILATYVGL